MQQLHSLQLPRIVALLQASRILALLQACRTPNYPCQSIKAAQP